MAGPDTPSPPPASTRQQRVTAELGRLLYSQCAVTLFAGLGAFLLTWAVLYNRVTDPELFTLWVVVGFLVLLVRLGLIGLYFRVAPDDQALPRWVRLYVAGMVLGGVVWGFGASFIGASESGFTQAFMVVLLAGVCAGALPESAPARTSYYLFISPILLAVVIRSLNLGEPLYLVVAGAGAIYAGLLVHTARNLHNTLRRSLMLAGENRDLVQTLTASKEQAEAAYRRLEAEAAARTRTAALLQASEARFDNVASTTYTAIMIYRESILYVNPALAAMTGFSQQELLGKEAWFVVHADHKELARARSQARLRGEDVPGHYELKLAHKDGQLRWVSMNAVLIDYEGTPAILATAYDVTERREAEQALRQSEEKYRLLVEGVTDTILIAQDDVVKFANGHVRELLGYSPEEFCGRPVADYVAPEFRALVVGRLRRRISESVAQPAAYAFQVVHRDGRKIWVELNAVRVEWEGRPATLNVVRDIHNQRLAEAALFDVREKAQVTLQSIADGVITSDRDGTVEYMNPVAEKLCGWDNAEASGVAVAEVFRVVDRADEAAVIPGMGAFVPAASEERYMVQRNGNRLAVEYSASPIRDKHGRLIGSVLVFRDITEVRALSRKLAYQAAHDDLTGLANRRAFEGRLTELLAAAEQGAVHALCYLDLDQFKIINDAAGHVAGDVLLQQLASVLGRRVRREDFLARLGGDEFGLLLIDCPLEQALEIAEGIVRSVRSFQFTWEGRRFDLGVSVGLVPITPEARTTAQLLSRGDVACYAAKDMGRNRVYVHLPEDRELERRHGEIMRAATLREALAENRFVLYCQPIVPVYGVDRGPLDFEILIRLKDDQGALLLPAEFIPAAEHFGLMGEIDRWVIRHALQAFAQGFDLFPDAGIAINLSGISISDDTLLDFLRRQFAETGVPPKKVCFELTETATVGNLSHATQFMSELKENGCRFALDDFGSGVSSFSYLKNLPVDFVKIDGAFVSSMDEDSIDHAMVEAINRVSHIMGIKSIVEGVDSAAVLELARVMGVDFVQGYAVDFPRPLAVLRDEGRWLQDAG